MACTLAAAAEAIAQSTSIIEYLLTLSMAHSVK